MFKKIAEKTSITKRLYEDRFYRTVFFTYFSLGLNVIYSISYAVMGVYKHSPWHGSLAAFYIFLSVMRFIVLWADHQIKKEAHKQDQYVFIWREYLVVGILLTLITIVFLGIVILLINDAGGSSYPGLFIYVICIYTFAKVIFAVKNLFYARKKKAPVMAMFRYIGQADALLSILSLQTAMFASFSDTSEGSISFIHTMNAATGTIVCVLIAFIGITMIIRAAGRLRKHES